MAEVAVLGGGVHLCLSGRHGLPQARAQGWHRLPVTDQRRGLAHWPTRIRVAASSPPETPGSRSGSQWQTCRGQQSGGHLDRRSRSRRERYGSRTFRIPKASRWRGPQRNSRASNPASTPIRCHGPEKCPIGSMGTNQRARSAADIRQSGRCRICKYHCSSPVSARL